MRLDQWGIYELAQVLKSTVGILGCICPVPAALKMSPEQVTDGLLQVRSSAGRKTHMSADTADEQSLARQAAADDLATRLKGLADHLGTRLQPQRMPYGRGLRGRFMSRSPEGYVVGRNQVLLPDGRLWSYSSSDAHRFPNGRLVDPKTDHIHYSGIRTFPGGTEFAYLGTKLGKFTFGVADRSAQSTSSRLCAVTSEGPSVRYIDADEAFAELERSLLSPP